MNDKQKLSALEEVLSQTPEKFKKATQIMRSQANLITALLIFAGLQTGALLTLLSYLVFFK